MRNHPGVHILVSPKLQQSFFYLFIYIYLSWSVPASIRFSSRPKWFHNQTKPFCSFILTQSYTTAPYLSHARFSRYFLPLAHHTYSFLILGPPPFPPSACCAGHLFTPIGRVEMTRVAWQATRFGTSIARTVLTARLVAFRAGKLIISTNLVNMSVFCTTTWCRGSSFFDCLSSEDNLFEEIFQWPLAYWTPYEHKNFLQSVIFAPVLKATDSPGAGKGAVCDFVQSNSIRLLWRYQTAHVSVVYKLDHEDNRHCRYRWRTGSY